MALNRLLGIIAPVKTRLWFSAKSAKVSIAISFISGPVIVTWAWLQEVTYDMRTEISSTDNSIPFAVFAIFFHLCGYAVLNMIYVVIFLKVLRLGKRRTNENFDKKQFSLVLQFAMIALPPLGQAYFRIIGQPLQLRLVSCIVLMYCIWFQLSAEDSNKTNARL